MDFSALQYAAYYNIFWDAYWKSYRESLRKPSKTRNRLILCVLRSICDIFRNV